MNPWFALVCAAMAGTAAVRGRMRRTFVAVTVRGESMRPDYPPGCHVVVRRNAAVAPDHVVVVEQPDDGGTRWRRPPVSHAARGPALSGRKWMIKRVAALPGDPVPRSVVPSLAGASHDRVPAGKVVLLGDNRESSFDSRSIGYFPVDRLLGTVVRGLSRRTGAPSASVVPPTG